jgi:tyrosinase
MRIRLTTLVFLCCAPVFAAPPPAFDAVYRGQDTNSAHTAQTTLPCKQLTPRKEWRTLEPEDQAAWLAAVKCLHSKKYRRLSLHKASNEWFPGAHSMYDELSFAHNKLHDTAHIIEYFLPWHRWFLNLFDKKLRSTCGYTGPTPYWDWTLDAADPFRAPVFDGNPITGFGGTGDCDRNDCVVQDGAFAPSPTPPHQFTLAYPIPHQIRRNLTLHLLGFENTPPMNETLTPERVNSIIQDTLPGDFYSFQESIQDSHNCLHEIVGGDLNEECPGSIPKHLCTTSYSPNDPLFWLHHAQMDRLWSMWQAVHPVNFKAFGGVPLNITWEDYSSLGDDMRVNTHHYDLHASTDYMMKFDSMSEGVRVSDMFDHQRGELCYEYL